MFCLCWSLLLSFAACVQLSVLTPTQVPMRSQAQPQTPQVSSGNALPSDGQVTAGQAPIRPKHSSRGVPAA